MPHAKTCQWLGTVGIVVLQVAATGRSRPRRGLHTDTDRRRAEVLTPPAVKAFKAARGLHQPRAYNRTTVAGPAPVESADLIGRDFTADRPGTTLVGDITYIRTWQRLAVPGDRDRRAPGVIGWALPSTCARAWSPTP